MKAGQGEGSISVGRVALPTLLVALFISASALAPCAGARARGHIYWATRSGDIGRANLDGTGVSPSFLSFPGTSLTHSPEYSPHDIAIAAGYIYWANWSTYIGRAKLNRTHVDGSFIRVRYGSPGYLATNARHVYWTEMAFEEPNAIGRANLDGTGVKNGFIRSYTSPFHIAVTGRRIYWTTPTSAIARANLDGGGVRPKLLTSNRGQPGGITAKGGHVYWTALTYSSADPAEATLSGWIGRARVDGTGVRWMLVGSGEEAPTDVAVAPGG